MVGSTSTNSLLVVWENIPCEERNVDFLQYQLKYFITSLPQRGFFTRVVGIETRRAGIGPLLPRTNYTIELRPIYDGGPNEPAASIVALTGIPQGKLVAVGS